MFENLQDKLDKAIKTLKGQGRITEINVAATIKEVRRALTDADVNYKVAKDITDRIREKALDRKVLISVETGAVVRQDRAGRTDRADGGRSGKH